MSNINGQFSESGPPEHQPQPDLLHSREVPAPRSFASLEEYLRELQWPSEAMSLVQALEGSCDFGVLVFDEEHRVILWNDEMTRLYGLDASETFGAPVTEVLSRVGRNNEDLLQYHIIQGIPMGWRESSHVHRQQGVVMTVRSSYLRLTDSKNTPRGGMVLVKDISTYMRMVKAGHVVENAFRSVVDRAADAILVLDGKGKILYGNQKACRMLGVLSQDLVVRNVTGFLAGEARELWSETMPGNYDTGEMLVPMRMVRTDGTVFDAECGVSHTSDDRLALVIRDVSDQQALYSRALQLKEFYESLAQQSREMIFSLSGEQRITFVNDAFTRITGWSRWIWLGRELSPLVHADDAQLWHRNMEAVLNGCSASLFRIRIRCADGRYMRGECSCSPVFTEGKINGIWHVVRTVDEIPIADEYDIRSQRIESRHYVS